MQPTQSDPLVFFRIVSGLGLIICAFATVFIVKNGESLYGIDNSVPSETASARTYSRLLIFGVLAHAYIFSAAGIFFL